MAEAGRAEQKLAELMGRLDERAIGFANSADMSRNWPKASGAAAGINGDRRRSGSGPR